MSLKKERFIKGIILAPDVLPLDNIEGEIKVDSADGKIKVTLGSTAREVITNSQSQTLTNKTLTSPVLNTGVSGTAINTSTTLASASNTQVPSALAAKSYADSIPSVVVANQTSFTIANNQTSAANITNLIINPATIRAAKIEYSIYRQTATAGSAVAQMGQLRVVYNTQQAQWLISEDYAGQDAGVTFSIDNSTGQVRYTSSNIAGTSYVGALRYHLVKTFGV